MYYLLEDNNIVDSENKKDIHELKYKYNCLIENGRIRFYKPRTTYECREACGKSGSFCVGCKSAFKAWYNKIKNQSENVFELIEVGDLVRYKTKCLGKEYLYTMEVIEKAFEDYAKRGFYDILAIYKPDEKGNYIKVWEKKMKVSECKKCVYLKRKRWVSSYKPKNYHCIGVSHVYCFCELLQKRCLEVKKKECKKKEKKENERKTSSKTD